MESAARRPLARGDVGASLARWSLAPVLVWIGAMRFSTDGVETFATALAESRALWWLSAVIPPVLIAWTTGLLQIGAGVLIGTGKRPGIRLRIGALISLVLAAASLSLFFTNPVWIESLGGFPFIGSGQGLLKNVTLLGVSLYLYSEAAGIASHETLHRPGLNVTLIGLVLVLTWIGLMKFTPEEAAGIQPLLETSPLFSWLLTFFTIQEASNLIGCAELLTAVLLVTFAIFASTLSFLLTLPGWHPTLGFPALGAAGQFLLKDLVLLAGILILLVELPPSGHADRRAAEAEPPREPPRETPDPSPDPPPP